MSTPAQRSARAALDAARPAVARLDSSRGPEDLAADLIETWGAVEAALRSLVGSTVLTGQPLIREARQRQLISFDLANSLAEFQAVHDRLQVTSYRANETDIEAARSAFLKLDSGLMGDSAETSPYAPRPSGASALSGAGPVTTSAAAATATPAPADATVVTTAPAERGMPSWAILAAVLVVIAMVGIGLFYAFSGRGSSSAIQQGVDAYKAGQREAAVSAFNKAVREDPKAPLPHIYLARMAREVGNFPLASQELELALQADPSNAIALREMGANMLAQGNYELARRFYVRAVQADPTDKSAQGYLGCSLMKLNRIPEATNFLNRAGPGPWTNCSPPTTTNPPAQPGAITGQPAPVRTVPRP